MGKYMGKDGATVDVGLKDAAVRGLFLRLNGSER